MREVMGTASQWLIWIAFFASSVYGHAALKLAVEGRRGMVAAALSPWGLSAFVAWTASGVLWMLVLTNHSLFKASSISSLRYVLITLAAWALWRRDLSLGNAAGMVLIAGGIYLVAR